MWLLVSRPCPLQERGTQEKYVLHKAGNFCFVFWKSLYPPQSKMMSLPTYFPSEEILLLKEKGKKNPTTTTYY